MPYRDGLDAMRREVQVRRDGVFDGARRLGYAHRAVLADGGAEIDAMHDRAMAFLLGEIATVDAGAEALSALDALRLAYEEARARAAARLGVEPLDGDVPYVAPDRRDSTTRTGADLREVLASVLARHGGASDFAEVGAGVRARFRVEKDPFSLTICGCERDHGTFQRFELTTTVPRVIRAFRLRPESGLDGLMRTVGMRSEHRIGALYFDASFWIEGDRPCAVGALTPLAQEALLELVDRDPVLRLDAGLARLAWISRAFSPEELRSPIAALVAVRRALAGGDFL